MQRVDLMVDRIIEEMMNCDAQVRSGALDEGKEFGLEVHASKFATIRADPYACDRAGSEAAGAILFDLVG